jgi:hypothetical protein
MKKNLFTSHQPRNVQKNSPNFDPSKIIDWTVRYHATFNRFTGMNQCSCNYYVRSCSLCKNLSHWCHTCHVFQWRAVLGCRRLLLHHTAAWNLIEDLFTCHSFGLFVVDYFCTDWCFYRRISFHI